MGQLLGCLSSQAFHINSRWGKVMKNPFLISKSRNKNLNMILPMLYYTFHVEVI
ncbi:hypothetical protein I79_001604 [Cricetulus griseus]|uniref:Uncharacterized protein n=1 Tax=Cricetulus griseus TaxID=10029 RepID=G3GV73_CRIGR|nr:hypothetical protein I79_001604 [Cricetulus griseus]